MAIPNMPFAAELLAQVEALAQHLPLPRVRALHLPQPTSGGKDGEFCGLELDDGSIGLSYVLLNDTLPQLQTLAAAGGGLMAASVLDLARQYRDGTGVARTLGFAACNAITRHLWQRAGFEPPQATDSLAGLDPQPGDHLGMIGFFPPLVKRIPRAGARLTVLELRADLLGQYEGFEVVQDPAALAPCNKVLCTSTVLLNDTLDAVLGACRGATQVALIGPGASCLPGALFARGVTVMGGVTVTDATGFADAVRRGESWGTHARKFALTPQADPGLDALIERAARSA